MVKARSHRAATFEDIEACGDEVHAEIVEGELLVHANPSWEHGYSQGAFSGEYEPPFQRGRGGPGGWWLLLETDIALSTNTILRPDITGIRRERCPRLPQERPLAVVPDFVCEILSPSTAAFDQSDKRALYHAAHVEHLWFLDPYNRLLTAQRWTPEGYIITTAARDGQRVRVAPFDAIEIEVSDLFPPPDETPAR